MNNWGRWSLLMFYIFISNVNFHRRVRVSNSLKLPNVDCSVVLVRLFTSKRRLCIHINNSWCYIRSYRHQYSCPSVLLMTFRLRIVTLKSPKQVIGASGAYWLHCCCIILHQLITFIDYVFTLSLYSCLCIVFCNMFVSVWERDITWLHWARHRDSDRWLRLWKCP